jgi:hypothetical protein
MSADYFVGAVAPSAGFGGTVALLERKDKGGDLAGANLAVTVPQTNSAGSLRVTQDGSVPRYFGNSQFAADSTATDIWFFPGVAGATIKVQRVIVSSVATAFAQGRMQLLRRSTANTAGTAVSAGIGYASADDQAAGTPNALGQPKHYTAHPTGLGTAAGVLRSLQYAQQPLATVAGPSYEFDLRTYGDGKGVRLSGTTDILALNVPAGLGGSGNAWDITVEWIEEPITA